MNGAAREVLKQYWPETLAVLEAAEKLTHCNAECVEAEFSSKPPAHKQHLDDSRDKAADEVIEAVERMQTANGRCR